MAVNECGDEVPSKIEELAEELSCVGRVRYVYRDGRYCKGRPVASVGVTRGARFRRDDFDYWTAGLRSARRPRRPGLR